MAWPFLLQRLQSSFFSRCCATLEFLHTQAPLRMGALLLAQPGDVMSCGRISRLCCLHACLVLTPSMTCHASCSIARRSCHVHHRCLSEQQNDSRPCRHSTLSWAVTRPCCCRSTCGFLCMQGRTLQSGGASCRTSWRAVPLQHVWFWSLLLIQMPTGGSLCLRTPYSSTQYAFRFCTEPVCSIWVLCLFCLPASPAALQPVSSFFRTCHCLVWLMPAALACAAHPSKCHIQSLYATKAAMPVFASCM